MKIRNKILAVFFLVFLLYSAGSLWENDTVKDVWDMTQERCRGLNFLTFSDDFALSAAIGDLVNTASAVASNNLPYALDQISLNGYALKLSGTRSYYNNTYGINISTDGYIVGKYAATSTDYEVQQLVALKKFLDERGIQLLYVNEPIKYINDSYYSAQFGGASYSNHNADLLLSRISDAGIDFLDLRDCIIEDNLDPLSLFYKTDHHWTVPAAKWAACKIAQKLNNHFGYNIDLSVYDNANFRTTEYPKSWLGEQGKLISQGYLGLDDYSMIEPLYPTEYSILSPSQAITSKGSFDIFINKAQYKIPENYYTDFSWHYSYTPYTNSTIYNHYANYGNVLVLGDSYETPMIPFLSLGIQKVKTIILRSFHGNLQEYIEAGNYDTIIVAYAQFMIGAHDDETNVNYKMFDFDITIP